MGLLTKSRGYAPLLSTFFDDFFTRDLFDWSSTSSTNTTIPKVNIKETENDYLVEMAAPGMKKDDFHVELNNGCLVISSEFTSRQGDQNYARQEFSYQSFSRTFNLPENVVEDKIEGKYVDGILKLVIPKREKSKIKSAKNIKIS